MFDDEAEITFIDWNIVTCRDLFNSIN